LHNQIDILDTRDGIEYPSHARKNTIIRFI